MSLPPPDILLLVGATFLLAGFVKGVVGFGLPTIGLGILAATVDLTSAMALMVAPSLATNVWQALAGGRLGALLRRFWPFYLTAVATVWVGALALSRVDLALLSGLLGLLLAVYAVTGLAGLRLQIAPDRERWAGPAFVLTNGGFTGMTGTFVVPGLLFLQATDQPRDALIQSMGIHFTLLTLTLAAALGSHALWTADLGAASMAGIIPALIGMALGQRARRRLPEVVFRRVFFVSVLLLGLYIMARAGGV